jgi:hypothetical protein
MRGITATAAATPGAINAKPAAAAGWVLAAEAPSERRWESGNSEGHTGCSETGRGQWQRQQQQRKWRRRAQRQWPDTGNGTAAATPAAPDRAPATAAAITATEMTAADPALTVVTGLTTLAGAAAQATAIPGIPATAAPD